MSRKRLLITDFSRGMVSDRLAGKAETGLFQKASSELTNFIVNPDGGVSRRRGTIFVRRGAGVATGIPAFTVFSKTSGATEVPYVGFIEPDTTNKFTVMNGQDHVATSLLSANLEPGEKLYDSGKFNDNVLASQQQLHIWGPTKSFLVDIETLATITEWTEQDISSIFQGRMIAVDRETSKLFFSVAYDFDNFTGIGALNFMPDHFYSEKTLWIKSRTGVYIGTTRAEYEVVSAYPAFTEDMGGIQTKKISSIGTDNAVYFGPAMVMSKDNRLLRMNYVGANQYQSNSIAEYIDNENIVTMDTIEYGSHRYLFFVDDVHDLYCLTESQQSEVAGWTKIMENVYWCKSFDQDLYITRKRGAEFWIEILPLDSFKYPWNRIDNSDSLFRHNNIHADAGGYINAYIDATLGNIVTSDYLPESETVSVYNLTTLADLGTNLTTATGELGTDAEIITLLGVVDDTPVDAYTYLDEFTSVLKTLPIPTGSVGAKKQIKNIVVKVFNSEAMKVRVNEGTWQDWSSTTFSGNVKFNVECESSDTVQVEIQSVGVKPLNILLIEADISGGDL